MKRFFLGFLFCLYCMFSMPLYSQSAELKSIVQLTIHGEIQPALLSFLNRERQQIDVSTTTALVLDIDTFGGRVDSAMAIVKWVQSFDDIPVYAFVSDKAWSAGALIALACDEIYMTPGSTIGSAAPVSGGSGEPLPEKYVSALRSKFRSEAERQGHPVLLAEAMVDKDVAIGFPNNQPDRLAVLTNEQSSSNAYTVVSAKGKLLNVTAQQALDYQLATKVYSSVDQLLADTFPSGYELDSRRLSRFDELVAWVTSSAVSGLLLSLGILLVFTELKVPGIGWAGAGAAICFAVVFGGHYVLEYANSTELIIFGIGLALIAVEIFILPGLGVAGLAGLILVLVSLYLSFVPFVVPTVAWEFSLFQRSLLLVLGSGVISILGLLVVVGQLDRLPGLRSLTLDTTLKGAVHDAVESQEKVLEPGTLGEAVSRCRPIGKGRFNGQVVDVRVQHGTIERGTTIRIIARSGSEYVVEQDVTGQK